MLKATVLAGFVVLVALPCSAQAPAPTPANLSAVLGLSGDSLLQNDLLFLAGGGTGSTTSVCTEGTTRGPYPDYNCCASTRFPEGTEERETDKCVNGQWQPISYTCTIFICKY